MMNTMQHQADIERLFADVIDQRALTSTRIPPVAKWNPPLSGDIDIRIARDGQWFHEGELIRREALVRVFSTILKREGDDYFLVTPAEKWRVKVDDAPFSIIAVERIFRDGRQALAFESSTGDKLVAGADHPLRLSVDLQTGEPSPYVLVRDRMEGLIARTVFYELAQWAEPGAETKQAVHGVYSLGEFFPLE
jgi:hypothetical protein